MVDEINALLKNKTWTLVPPSSSQNLIGYKWVFRVKHKPEGTTERHKTRLVAKGFH
jgi:histone deacetylase 1/2